MKWRNELLTWNPDEWGGIRHISVKPDMVWIPDIILKNNADSDAITIQKDTDQVWMKHDGSSSWYPKVMIISSFRADVTYFPFDSQTFIFHFGSWSLDEHKLQIVKDDRKPILDKHYLNDSEWALVSMEKHIHRSSYTDAYIEIIFTYFFARKPTYSVITAIVPSIGLMSMALFSYLLPPDIGERIAILITSLLAFTVFLVEINGSLPRNSDSVPIVQVFYMVTMAECILCFIVSCLLARIVAKRKHRPFPYTVPAWMKRNIFCLTANRNSPADQSRVVSCELKCMGGGCESFSRGEVSNTSQNGSAILNCEYRNSSAVVGCQDENTSTHECNAVTWGMVADVMDWLSFRIFTLTFLASSIGILVPAYLRTRTPTWHHH